MKDKLKQVLELTNILNESEIAEGLKHFTPLSLKKGELLIEAGTTCKWMAFVNTGVLRNFYYSSKDEEVTYCITFPNKIITALSSFITQKKTFENVHALTDVDVLIIKRDDYYKVMDSSSNWLKFSRFVAEQSYIEMENRLLAVQMESAKKRYKDLIENHPDYLQNVPLKYLASFLGITQRHLSRLRKEIS